MVRLETMLSVWNWLLTLSPVIAAAIIAGIFTCTAALLAFIGIALSLWAHRWRERVAREHEMKREVCFSFIASVANVFEFIGQIGSLHLPESELRALIKDYPSDSASFQLVGDLGSLTNLARLDEMFHDAMASLSIKRVAVLQLKNRREAINKNQEELLERIKQLRPLGTTQNADEITALKPIWQDLMNRYRDVDYQVRKGTLDIYRTASRFAKEMTPVHAELLSTIRISLGLKVVKKDYIEDAIKSAARRDAQIKELCDRLESELKLEMEENTATIEGNAAP